MSIGTAIFFVRLARRRARRRPIARPPIFKSRRPRRRSEGRAFPDEAAEELAYATDSDDPFTPGELPGELDDEGRLVLVRRLVREGFLVLSEAARENGAGAEE